MKLFVWDCHNTLVKGNDAAVAEITNMALEQFGYSKRMTDQDSERLSGRAWRDYFAYLIPGEPPERYQELEALCIDMSEQRFEIISRNVKANDCALEILDAIAAKHTQIVISYTPPDVLHKFLKAVDLHWFFPGCRSFGVDTRTNPDKTKRSVLEDYLKKQPMWDDIIAIGDSPFDMVGKKNYLYALPGRNFRECPSDYKIRNLRELIREF